MKEEDVQLWEGLFRIAQAVSLSLLIVVIARSGVNHKGNASREG